MRKNNRCTDPRAAAVLLALAAAGPAFSQGAPAGLALSTCVEEALSSGADHRILQQNLAVSREQYNLSVSQASPMLSASVGESALYAYGDANLLTLNSIASGFSQSPQAGIVLSTPMTTLGLSTTPYMAASPLAAEIGGFLGTSPGASGSLNLSLSQAVWNGYPGGTAKAALEKSLLSFRSSELSVDTGKLSIISAVTRAYYAALSAQRVIIVKEQILDQQKALLAQIRAMRDLQQATDVDFRTAEINAQTAEIDLSSAQDDLRIARIRLAQLIGRPRDSDLSVAESEDPQVPVASVEEAIAEALKRRTEIRQIDLNRQSAAIDRALIQGQTLPTVSVTAGATMIVDWKALTTAGQGSVGVKVEMPVLDAGAASHQLEANRLENDIYTTQESQLRASIATDVEEAYDLVQVQLQRVQVARLTQEKFQMQFMLKKKSAEFGTATNQDLLDASVNAANAQSAVVAAQASTQAAILQLRLAMGY